MLRKLRSAQLWSKQNMSDGCPHAGIGIGYNFGWQRDDIIIFMEAFANVGYTAKTLSTCL